MVEWKKLGEVCEIGTGSNNREDAREHGRYPFFVRSQEILRIDSYLFDEEAILIPGEGGIGDIFHYVKGKYGLHQRTYRVHPISDLMFGKYIYYYLFANFKSYINQKSYKATAASIRKPMLLNFPIPLPSLAEQERIVGILDTFTGSIENLKEQIAQRRKQYEHYRDQLLDLEGKPGVEMKKLGEVCNFQNGFAFKSGLFKEQGAPIVRITNITSNTIDMSDCVFFDIDDYSKFNLNPFIVNNGDVLLAMSGATTGKTGVYKNNYKAYLNQRVGKFVPITSLLNNRFLYHYLLSKTNTIYIMAGGGAQPNLSSNKLMGELRIPLPSLSEQERIVSILDTFEASIANLETQQKEREKQYEYYRNKLLTFE